tara:strand:- start:47220 stop:47846 length:627 start_codon:yes stop_codon:yes gene_type:complete
MSKIESQYAVALQYAEAENARREKEREADLKTAQERLVALSTLLASAAECLAENNSFAARERLRHGLGWMGVIIGDLERLEATKAFKYKNPFLVPLTDSESEDSEEADSNDRIEFVELKDDVFVDPLWEDAERKALWEDAEREVPDLFQLDEFTELVDDGGFVDYDGWGHPIDEDGQEVGVFILPSKWGWQKAALERHGVKKIAWYNR